MPEEKKDYRIIIENCSKNHSQDYLFGYVRCLHIHRHINMKEAMGLIDFSVKLSLKKKGMKV